jgi:hypothetical protein
MAFKGRPKKETPHIDHSLILKEWSMDEAVDRLFDNEEVRAKYPNIKKEEIRNRLMYALLLMSNYRSEYERKDREETRTSYYVGALFLWSKPKRKRKKERRKRKFLFSTNQNYIYICRRLNEVDDELREFYKTLGLKLKEDKP